MQWGSSFYFVSINDVLLQGNLKIINKWARHPKLIIQIMKTKNEVEYTNQGK